MLKERIAGCICAAALMAGTAVEALAEGKGYEDIPYQELFTQGKEWTWVHIARNPTSQPSYSPHYIINVRVDGSGEIEGIACKRLVISKESLAKGCNTCTNWLDYDPKLSWQHGVMLGMPDEVFVYEKDRRIYFYRDPGVRYSDDDPHAIEVCDPYFDILMDLNAGTGDYVKGFGTINADDLVEINGRTHRRLTTGEDPDNIMDWSISHKSEWIEGIGASDGLSMYEKYYLRYKGVIPDLYSPAFILAECREDGVTLYDRSDLLRNLGVYMTNGIGAVEEQDCHPEGCFDLQGRPIDGPTHGQPYIQDGKIRFIL